MKKPIIIFLFFVNLFANAQQNGAVALDWTLNQKYSYGTFDINIPQIKSKGFDFDIAKKQINYILKLQQQSNCDENSLQLSNIVFENITESELGELNRASILSDVSAKLSNVIARDEWFAQITLSPIVKFGNEYKIIKSFSYSFSSAATENKSLNINSTSVVNSVLSTGDWYRFYVTKSGVYSLNKSFLESLGINLSGINPKKIKIYGNGGRMLPLKNNVPYPDDLDENAIQVIGESDGVFDAADSILLYAEGVDTWSDESRTFDNLYADKSYYYINLQGVDGKRIATMSQPAVANTAISIYNNVSFYEVDKINIGRLGRQWYGDGFDINAEQTFNFNIPNISAATQINTEIHLAAKAKNNTSFNLKINNIDKGNISLSASTVFSETTFINTIPAIDNVAVKLTFSNGGVPSSIGYLDYIILKSTNDLKGIGKQYPFQYNLSASIFGAGTYNFTNASGISQIWDITDIYNVTKTENNPAQSNFSFKSNFGILKKYTTVDISDLYVPGKDEVTKISNQNLHGTIFNNPSGTFLDIDYLIITPSFLSNQAEKLANFHRTNSNLNVKVVTLESIYPEFGSGKQDVAAIRNFVKYVYNNASTASKRVKYVNLFGDASFDHKNRIPSTINTNIVPIYHALISNSLGESSFSSDDFFGMMDNNEGLVENFYGGLDIAVGRMIVSSIKQAEEMVNKVIEYHDLKAYGNWRNNYTFISDDADKSSDVELQVRQNQLSDVLWFSKPFINIKKIWLDSYVQVSSAAGFRYPGARNDIFNSFQKGALVFNYLGHGGEESLAQEAIWIKSDGQNLENQYKYPLFITITCDFSRFDNPYRKTAGEFVYWNPKGGAIGMITTIREIGQGGAQNFNDKLQEKLFPASTNDYPTIAESLRLAKNQSFGSTNNVVFYIGDPALKLAIPKQKVVLTKVNDMPVTGTIDDFKSLAYIKLSGEIQDENNVLQNTYNGDLSIQIFDKNIPRTTLNNDFEGSTMPFITLGETICRGNAAVNNGLFEFGFVVPRDIRIPLGNGKISFYGKRGEVFLDKTGYTTDIKVGGVNLNAVADITPPKVRLYKNDESFVNGGITNQNPIFLAFLEDENGINTASGIGHDIIGILDGDEINPYVMNDYYETELNNYKKGKVKFPFKNLALGLHTIKFKAWDVYNNLVTAEIQFVVVDNEGLTLTNVLNYPNPFVNYTQFWFTHNRPFEPLDVQVQIMTITGKVVWTHNQIITTTGFLSKEISWDGKDDFGDKIGKGVYVYKLTVKSTTSDASAEKYEKLVIL
jgi:Peptidase family C25